MREVGQLLASGRDADIFECGPGLVLRRSRERRSLVAEAQIMTFLHTQGYPVPAIDEISPDGTELVMERIDGPSMVDAIARRPWTVRRSAAMLAELHVGLHDMTAPAFLAHADIGLGDRIVHMDLHPLNVIMGPRGPVVIDWARSGRGDPAVDVAIAWLLIASAGVPASAVKAAIIRFGREKLTKAFLRHFDQAEVGQRASEVVEWKAKDANMTAAEITTMRRLAGEAAARI